MPLYSRHQRYRELVGQKAMAEAWYRLMQRTCQHAEELGDADDNSELTMETLYTLRGEAQVNSRRARSKLDDFLRSGQRYG